MFPLRLTTGKPGRIAIKVKLASNTTLIKEP